MAFRKRLRLILKSKGMSQKELALRIHVNESTISNWLSGKRTPHLYQAFNIAEIFGISVETLWFGNQLLDDLLEKLYGEYC